MTFAENLNRICKENPDFDGETGDEFATYDDLKAEILSQAEENSIDPAVLEFPNND